MYPKNADRYPRKKQTIIKTLVYANVNHTKFDRRVTWHFVLGQTLKIMQATPLTPIVPQVQTPF